MSSAFPPTCSPGHASPWWGWARTACLPRARWRRWAPMWSPGTTSRRRAPRLPTWSLARSMRGLVRCRRAGAVAGHPAYAAGAASSPRRALARPACRSCRTPNCCFRRCARSGSRARFAGITGTNGKSTTTALLAHMLSAAGRPVAAGANLGPPALSLPLLPEDGVYVLEMSSLHVGATRRAPLRCGGNAESQRGPPGPPRRHGGLCRAPSGAIFDRQTGDDLAVIGVDDAGSRDMAAGCARPGAPGHHVRRKSRGYLVRDGRAARCRRADRGSGRRRARCPARTTRRTPRRRRRWRCALGVSRATIAAGIRQLSRPAAPPAARRRASTAWCSSTTARRPTPMPPRARSAATTGWSGSPAAWPRRRHRAAGAVLSRASRCPADRPRRAGARRDAGARMVCRIAIVGTLEPAVPAALARGAAPGAPVVLLSPACASLGPVHRLRPARRPFRRPGWQSPKPPPGGRMMRRRFRAPITRCWAAGGGRWIAGRCSPIGTLIGFGYVMMLAASPAVAERINQSRDLFILKQVFFLALAGADRGGGVAAVAARGAAGGARRLPDRAGADRAHAGGGRRDQGCAALGRRCRGCRCSRASSSSRASPWWPPG